MKKLRKHSLFLCVFLLLAALLPSFALALDGTEIEATEPQPGKYIVTVTAEDGVQDGEHYSILVLADSTATTLPATLTAADILYVNQAAAADGKVVFAGGDGSGFIPMTYAGGSVFVSGPGLDGGTIRVGTLATYGVTYTVTVTSYGDGAPTLTFSDGTNTYDAIITGTESPHDMSLAGILEGTYILTISKPGHGTYTETLEMTADVTESKEIYRYGDVNRSGTVNATDAVLVLRHGSGIVTLGVYQQVLADVNGSNTINATDAVLLLRRGSGLINSFPIEDNE